MSTDRRRAPRVEILGGLHGHTVSPSVSVGVREISLVGMAVHTITPLAQGAVHEFLLTLGDGSTVQLTGRVIRCRQVTTDDESDTYIAGIEFIDEDEADAAGTVGGLIDKVR